MSLNCKKRHLLKISLNRFLLWLERKEKKNFIILVIWSILLSPTRINQIGGYQVLTLRLYIVLKLQKNFFGIFLWCAQISNLDVATFWRILLFRRWVVKGRKTSTLYMRMELNVYCKTSSKIGFIVSMLNHLKAQVYCNLLNKSTV